METLSIETQEDVFEIAQTLFEQFELREISLNEFQQELINLTFTATENKIENWENGVEMIIPIICEQFNLYRENKKENGFLLSRNSSGSLLTQFEPYCE